MVLIVVGFGCGKRGGRGAVKLLMRSARFCWGLVAELRMRPDIVVIVAPERQGSAGICQGIEDLLVEAFVAQTGCVAQILSGIHLVNPA